MPAYSPIMTTMVRAAEKASRALLRDFNEVEHLQVSRKGPADFVTAADKRSEKILFEELQKVRPDWSFIMEESGQVKGNDPDHVWLIDPLDGTHNFMHAIPHWCISIALERKGDVVAALVYDCAKDELFTAEKGGGAFLRNRRLRISGRRDLESSIINMGQPFGSKEDRARFFEEQMAVNSVAMVRRFGSAALDLAYVAAGRLDGYWERNLKPWDTAAGILLVKEAGGTVTSIENDDNPVYSANLVAGNAQVHSEVRKIVKKSS